MARKAVFYPGNSFFTRKGNFGTILVVNKDGNPIIFSPSVTIV